MRSVTVYGAYLVAQLINNLPAKQETPVQFLGREDLLEKGQATRASILGLLWWLRQACISLNLILHCSYLGSARRRQCHPTPVLLPGKSHGRRSLVGCSPWGRQESDTTSLSLSLFTLMHWRRKWQPTPVFWPGESQGQGAPRGLPSLGSHRVRHE